MKDTVPITIPNPVIHRSFKSNVRIGVVWVMECYVVPYLAQNIRSAEVFFQYRQCSTSRTVDLEGSNSFPMGVPRNRLCISSQASARTPIAIRPRIND